MKRKMIIRKKFCRFCAERMSIDYKDGKFLQTFVNERFKILPRRITGVLC
jgi:small subunit ribosomal protein S18